MPGVVLVAPDGTIAYRRISDDKADRPTLRALLAEIDRAFGAPAVAPALHDDYAPVRRIQLGLGLGGGALRRDDAWEATASATLAARVPFGRHLLVGAAITAEDEGRLDLDATVGARLPFYADLASLELFALGGHSAGDLYGWHAGGGVAVGFAATPSWGFRLQLGGALHRGDAVEAALSLEITRLIVR